MEYPQVSGQKPGCGFPIARIVVVFSLSVGTVLDAAIGKYQGKQTGENSLFRTLHDLLQEDDVVLADRYFSGWFDLALVRQRGAHVVVRKHQLRATDFRTGHRLGRNDHQVRWSKPKRPAWMSQEQYDALPKSLTLREVRVHVAQKGFRTQELVVVTTLLDPEPYPADEIANLYRRRWQAEFDIRDVKVTLDAENIEAKSVEMFQKELYASVVAYNLVAQFRREAAKLAQVQPRRLSFKGVWTTFKHRLLLQTGCSFETWLDCWAVALYRASKRRHPNRRAPRSTPRKAHPRRPKSTKFEKAQRKKKPPEEELTPSLATK